MGGPTVSTGLTTYHSNGRARDKKIPLDWLARKDRKLPVDLPILQREGREVVGDEDAIETDS